MTIDDYVKYLREALDSVKPNVHTEFRMSPQEVEQLLYWLTEYRAMISGRQSDNLSERLAEHLVWAESNSYEFPVTLAEDLEEAINTINRLPSESSWIPCSERLPEVGDLVMIAIANGDIDLAMLDKDKVGFSNGDWYNARNVTHWMPLQQPTKEVDAT